MNSKRLFIILSSAISLLIVLIGLGAKEINSLLSSQANKLTDLKATNQALAQEQAILIKDKKDIGSYSSLNQIAKVIVPEDKDQAEAVREITNFASKDHVVLDSITFPASTLSGTLPSSASSSSSISVPLNANSKTVKLSQLTPVKNLPGVYSLVINIQSDTQQTVSYSNFINFLSDLEYNRRTDQISNITITPDNANPGNISFTITLNEYIKP